MNGKGNSFSNGPAGSGNSAYNGPFKVLHDWWFCACHWCLNGVKS